MAAKKAALRSIDLSAVMFAPSSIALSYSCGKMNGLIIQGNKLCMVKPSMQSFDAIRKGEVMVTCF